ncbi:FitA-like ribbon-helix-helix domain-containing protein [Streptococcus pseudopneumoniae]|uniref:FitA-like ribbon-helix-helix domain-containing protein n=1 Tax=Streptococcus pseudopneumoniae TaxID=257758 RepID=UPI001BB0FD77
MPVTLSIKNVPDKILKRLRRRAADHRRSLQGELIAIIEQSVLSEEQLTVEEVISRVRRSGLRTPSESTRIIRMDRNAR